LTLRDDFQHYFENSEQLQNYWKNNACFRVNSMGRDQLREAIEQPAAAQDLYFETKDDKSLVVQLLDDIGDTSGALPLLSFTLSELYYKYVQKGCSDRTLRWKDYEGEDDGALGGVTKAITRKATEVYNDLVNDFVDGQAIKVEPLEVGQARQTMLRWVMLRMVTLDGGEKAKRPVLDDELTYRDTETEQWNKHRELVIDRFVDARLLVKGTNLEGKNYVEPAHDILVREWDKIRTWLGETSEPVNETKKQLKQSGQDEHLTLETPEPVNETEKQPDSKPQSKPWLGLRLPLMRRNNQPEKGQEKFNLNLQRELAIAAKKWDSVRKENPVEQNNPASSTNESAIFRRVGTAHQSSIFRRVGNAHPTVVALKIGGLGAFKRINPQRLLALSNAKKAVGLLWNSDPRLPQAEQIAKSNDNWLNKLEAEFVQRSVSKERQNKIIGWSIAGIVMAGSMIFSAAVWTQWRNSELNLANSMGQYSLSLLAEQRGLEAWVQAIKAGRILQKHNIANPVVINALLANASGVVESNRLEGENIAATSFSFSPDSKTLAASRDDRMIEIWDLETGQKTHSFRGHEEGEVFGISFSPDGRFLATGSDDKMIKLWDLETGTEIHTFLGHTDLVRSISFSPDGRILASGSDDGTIKLWDLETGTEISTTEGFGNVSFSPDGKTLAFISGDGMIKLWNLETGEIRTLQVQIGSYSDLSFSSDGQTLVFGSDSGTIELWDLESAQPVLILQGDAVSFSFSSDGRTLTTASSDNMVTRWDLEMGTEVYTFRADEGDFSFVNFSPDGRTLAIGGFSETIKLVNLEKENEVWTINEVGGAIFEVSFSSDGKTLVSSGYPQRIKLWSLETGQEILIFEDSNNASSPSISLNGKTLAAINIDNKVEFWDLETGQKIPGILEHEEDAVFSVSFSPDGRTLATGSDNTINLWDLETGEKIHTLQVPNGVGSVSFSPDGRTLATDSNDNMIKLWNLETGAEIYTLQRHTDTIRSLSFSPGGKTLASGSEDRTIKLWDLETGTEIRTLQGHERSVRSVSFSPDGRTLASGSDDKTIKLWNLEEGKENDIRTLQGHTDGIGTVSFSPDGKTLVSGSADETIKLWNLDFWRLDLDALMERSCDWARAYLQNNPNVSESDRHLCDGISNVEPDESASAASVIPTLPPLSCNEPPLPSLPSQRPGYYKHGEYYGSIETTSPPNEQLTLILPSGDRYDGEFANGKRNGCGTYTFANGNHYVGEFLDDKFHGQGEYFGRDGKFYRGEFSEGKCQGQGTLTLADGTSKTGEWQNGNLIGGSPTDSCNR
jgi:WD40 repeat protein